MSENVQVEQPQDISKVVSDEGQVSTINDSGSTFGKFKDATSLLSAYNSLEAEFTRKSQKLSEIMKNLDKGKQEAEDSTQEINKGSSDMNNNSSNALNENESSLQIKETWEHKVDDFFSRTPEAKESAKSIVKVLKENPELKNIKNGIDIAYKLSSAISSPADLLSDPKFVNEHIMTNQNIKEEIIKEYLKSATKTKTLPTTLQGNSSYVYASSLVEKPSSIENAGKIFQQMLTGK